MNLRSRFALLVAVTFLPVVGSTLLTLWHEERILHSHIREDALRMTQAMAGTHEHAINSTRQLLMALSDCVFTCGQAPEACGRKLSLLRDEHPVYADIGFAPLDREHSCNSRAVSDQAAPSPASSLPYRDGITGFVLDTWQGDYSARPGIRLSYFFSSSERGPCAAVFAVLDFEHLHQFSDFRLPEGAEYLLVAENGTILAAMPDTANMTGRSASEFMIVRTIFQAREGVSELPGLDGITRLYAFKPLSGTVDTGLYVGVGLPSSTYRATDRILVLDLMVLTVSIAAAGVFWMLTDRMFIRRVDALVDTAQQLSSGLMKARTGLPYGRDEMDRLARAVDEMADALETRTDQLITYQEQLRSMASQLSLTEERERRRIATELHDRIGQTLAISKIRLGALIQTEDRDERNQSLLELKKYLDQAIGDTRSLTFRISSPILYELGLEAALEWLAENVKKEHGIDVTFADDRQEKPLDDDIRILLFRAANELLVNAVKHSGAAHVAITAARDESGFLLEIRDDGVGFDASGAGLNQQSTRGFGLFSIRERLTHFKGSFELESSPGCGTRAILKAPLKEAS